MDIQTIQRKIVRVGTLLARWVAGAWLLLALVMLLADYEESFSFFVSVFATLAILAVGSFIFFRGCAEILARTAERWLNPDDLQGIGQPRNFDVYNHPTHGYKAVKVGFCWPACIFGPMWMLFCRLWEQGGIFLSVLVVFRVLDLVFPPTLIVTVPVTFFLSVAIFGFRGNRWRSTNLQARGYQLVATVPADSKDGAIVQARKTQAE